MEKNELHQIDTDGMDEIAPAAAVPKSGMVSLGEKEVTEDMRDKISSFYGRKAEHDGIAPSRDFLYILDKVNEMTEEEAMRILVNAIEFHKDDPNFPGPTMTKIRQLVQGPKAEGLEDVSDFDFDLRAEAAIIHYHSPYPEVRSVTEPFDDPTLPVETIRSYFLGMVFMVRRVCACLLTKGRSDGSQYLLFPPTAGY